MEGALRALRRLSVGSGDEGAAFRAAGRVPAAAANAVATAALVEKTSACGSEESDEEAGLAPILPSADVSGLEATGRSGTDSIVELYTWGRSTSYQLGFGCSGEEQVVPRLTPLPKGIELRLIACGEFHSVAVAACGSVFCWGFNGSTGRLGVETAGHLPKYLVEPVMLPEFGPGRHVAVKVAAGMNHSLALTSAGKVLTWGSNVHGQLGLQGVPTGEAAHVRRPQVLKSAIKGEEIRDVAAGALHSLCVTAPGNVYVWGSNCGGGLGLGPPPAGPAEVAAPQQLPHLRGATAVAASASKHISIVIAAHGDAIIFGTCGSGEGRSAAAREQGGWAAAADARFHLPSRVRRRGHTKSADLAEEEHWQTKRSSATVSASGPPLRSVVLGAEEGFGVDTKGVLWTWPLLGPRPCCAEVLVPQVQEAANEPEPPLQLGSVSAIAVRERNGTLWAVDGSASACLWQLRRSSEGWRAERFEQLAQISSVACSAEHQAVLVTYRRPPTGPEGGASRDMADSAAEVDKEELSFPDNHNMAAAASDCVDVGIAEPMCSAQSPRRRVPSLQQICEERIGRLVSPKNFGVVCEVAWDLCMPLLLDLAYAFLQANASLMFSRQHLATLSQLPFEVLAAFELAAAGRLPAPSDAFEAMFNGSFPPEDILDAPAQCSGATVDGGAAAASAAGQRRRRRAGTSGPGGNAAAIAGSPALHGGPAAATTSPIAVPAKSPKALPAKSPTLVATRPPKLGGAMLGRPATSLGAGAAEAKPALPDPDWVEVRGARRKATATGGLTSPHLASSTSPKLAAASPGGPDSQRPVGAGAGAFGEERRIAAAGQSPVSKAAPMHTYALLDFVRTKPGQSNATAKAAPLPVAEGPSAMLSAAVESAQVGKGSPWGAAAEAPETAVSLRDILEEQGGASGSRRPKAAATSEDPANDPTRNAWGFEALLSEKPKGRSVYEIQQQEKTEKSRLREDEEIQELEAMFAALEVAEEAEREEDRAATAPTKRLGGRRGSSGGAGVAEHAAWSGWWGAEGANSSARWEDRRGGWARGTWRGAGSEAAALRWVPKGSKAVEQSCGS